MQNGHARHTQYQRSQKREWLKLSKDLENSIIGDNVDLNSVRGLTYNFRSLRDSILGKSPTIVKEEWVNEPVGDSDIGRSNSSSRDVNSVYDRHVYKKP